MCATVMSLIRYQGHIKGGGNILSKRDKSPFIFNQLRHFGGPSFREEFIGSGEVSCIWLFVRPRIPFGCLEGREEGGLTRHQSHRRNSNLHVSGNKRACDGISAWRSSSLRARWHSRPHAQGFLHYAIKEREGCCGCACRGFAVREGLRNFLVQFLLLLRV